MSGRVLKEGFLVKSPPLEKSLASWKKRYFKLWESGRLDYFESNKSSDQKPKGTINLLDVKEVSTPMKQEFDRPYCIKIVTEERAYVIQCGNEAELNAWHDQIGLASGQNSGESGSGDLSLPKSTNARQVMPLPDIPGSTADDNTDAMRFESPSCPPDRPPILRPDQHSFRSVSSDRPPQLPVSQRPIMSGSQTIPRSAKFGDVPPPGRSSVGNQSNVSSFRQPPLPARPVGGRADQDANQFGQLNLGPKPPSPKLPSRSSASHRWPSSAEPPPGGESAVMPPRRKDNYTMVDFSSKSKGPDVAAPPPAPAGAPAARINYTMIDLQKTEDYNRKQVTRMKSEPAPFPSEPIGVHHQMLGDGHQDTIGYVKMMRPTEKMNRSGPPPHSAPSLPPRPGLQEGDIHGRPAAPLPAPRDQPAVNRRSIDAPPALPARRM